MAVNRKPATEPMPGRNPNPDYSFGAVSLAEIRPSPFNVRRRFDAADIEGLAESIQSIGLKEPLLVRPIWADGVARAFEGDWKKHVSTLELVDGERRYRALQTLDPHSTQSLDRVPVLVRDLTDAEVRAIMLASREQSRDLAASELVAGYVELRESLPDDATLAAKLGKSVGHVRSILRLARLPAWALAAVDDGTLPRATAELVARVPGQESREKAAACVLLGFTMGLMELRDEDLDQFRRGTPASKSKGWEGPLSYRDTKELLRRELTIELKSAPFSRKELYTWPGCEPGHERTMPDCNTCPSRAGNDEEAKADGVRADACLDPDCYRAKVEAHDERERVKFRKRYRLADDADLNPDGAALAYDGRPAKGWLDWNGPVRESELAAEFAGKKVLDAKVSDLVLECPIVTGCMPRLVLDAKHKPRHLVKTSDVIKTLRAAEVLPKPEPRKKEERVEKPAAGGQLAASAASGPTDSEVMDRSAVVAADKCRAMLMANAESLAELSEQGGPDTDAVYQALSFIARVLTIDWLDAGSKREQIVSRYIEVSRDIDVTSIKDHVESLTPAELVGYIFSLTSAVVFLGPAGFPGLGRELLDYADTSEKDCEEQARRELAGEPSEASAAPACAARLNTPLSLTGRCWVCDCTETDCSACIERTGEPCTWVDAERTLCSACQPLLEADIGILFMGMNAIVDQGLMSKLRAAGVHTIGQVMDLLLDCPPKRLKQERLQELAAAAEQWIERELAAGGPSDSKIAAEMAESDVMTAEAAEILGVNTTVSGSNGV